MDLFVVNRFTGDEKPEASDEKEKLDKVLKKIKKRKLAREKTRQKENLKLNRVSLFKKEKVEKRRLKRKFKSGLLSKEEAQTALRKKIVKIEDLAAKINKGQILPTKEPEEKAIQLTNQGVVKLEPKVKPRSKKKKKAATSNSDTKTTEVTEQQQTSENEVIPEEKLVELTPEEIAEQLLQKQIEKIVEQTDETKKSKKRKKKAVVPEPIEPETSETPEEPETQEAPETPEGPSKKKPKKSQKLNPDDVEGFTILGVDKFAKKKTVKRVLPKWLRNPTIISSDLNNLTQKISQADLNPQLIKTLKEKQIKHLFPVQAEFIPWQLKTAKTSGLITPQDACISAPTGSGKTLAFTIPVLQSLLQQLENRCLTIKAIRALVILPTQSLAMQIYDTFKSLISGCDINVGLATGAGNRTLEAEQKQLITYNSIWGTSSKVDILVCTAGRLVDHLKSTKGFDLKHLQYIIIDEADRVLDSIQDDWLYHLGIHLKEDTINRNIVNVNSVKSRTDPQKLLFSATLSQDPEKLQKLSLFQPKLFTCITENEDVTEERFIGKYTTPAELTEKYIICTIEIKPLVLYKLIIDEIDKNKKSRILVFVNTVETLHRLNVLLKYMGQEKFTVAEFSSNQGNLKARKNLLKKFEDGLIQVLVCTDSMARGIDIPNVDCVISYSVPNHLKTYIHRAGRTARAGSSGLCISMMHAKQQKTFLTMIDNMKSQTKNIEEISIPDDDLEILTPLYEQCLVQLKEKVSDEAERSANKIKTRKLAFNKKKQRKSRKNKRKTVKNKT